MQQAEVFQITTIDKIQISATLFIQPKTSPHLIIICPAAGTPQYYYKSFAEYASGYKDFDVLTFDYRGIGQSLSVPITQEHSTMSDWGEKDLNAVLNWADRRYDKICLLGHSVAGQIFPKAKLQSRVLAAYFVASQTAYNGYWKGFWRIYVMFFWKLIIPVATSVYHYLPGWAMGGNVHLSQDAAREWRKWGLHPEGVLQGDMILKRRFEAVKIPTHFVSFEDDEMLAPVDATRALMSYYKNAITSFQFIRPSDLKLQKIGHFGFFKKQFAKQLWPMPMFYFSQYVNKLG